MTFNKCDFCNNVATTGGRDILEVDNYHSGILECEVVNDPRYGCDDHPQKARVVGRRSISREELMAQGYDVSLGGCTEENLTNDCVEGNLCDPCAEVMVEEAVKAELETEPAEPVLPVGDGVVGTDDPPNINWSINGVPNSVWFGKDPIVIACENLQGAIEELIVEIRMRFPSQWVEGGGGPK